MAASSNKHALTTEKVQEHSLVHSDSAGEPFSDSEHTDNDAVGGEAEYEAHLCSENNSSCAKCAKLTKGAQVV
jgi:hypothetical protein